MTDFSVVTLARRAPAILALSFRKALTKSTFS